MLNNKVALVCASSAGIGRGIATRLAEAGCHVALLGRRAVKLEEAATEISKRSNHKVMPVVCDLSNIDEVEKAYQRDDLLVFRSKIMTDWSAFIVNEDKLIPIYMSVNKKD